LVRAGLFFHPRGDMAKKIRRAASLSKRNGG
jgi:hypothetical protein